METKTREQALRGFMAAKERKRECVERIEKKMKESYEKRTGKKANCTFVL